MKARGDLKATLLFIHGNAENISTHIGHVYWLVDHGFDVVAIDYRGYGRSQGKVDLQGSIGDVRTAINYVANNQRNLSQGLVLMGQSLGGSMSIAALSSVESRKKVSGLVVVSAFSDYHRVTREALSGFWLTWAFQYPLSWTVSNEFSPLKHVGGISPIPVVIMHGVHDPIINIAHAESLYEAANDPKFLEKIEGDHNHIFEIENNRELLLSYLRRFLLWPDAQD